MHCENKIPIPSGRLDRGHGQRAVVDVPASNLHPDAETTLVHKIVTSGKQLTLGAYMNIARSLGLITRGGLGSIDEYREKTVTSLLKKDLSKLICFDVKKYRGQVMHPYSKRLFSSILTREGELRKIDATLLDALITDVRFLTISQLVSLLICTTEEYGGFESSTAQCHEDLKRLIIAMQSNLAEALLSCYLSHYLGGGTWENAYRGQLCDAKENNMPSLYERLDAQGIEWLRQNGIVDQRQILRFANDLFKIHGMVELMKVDMKSKNLPTEPIEGWIRVFSRGQSLKQRSSTLELSPQMQLPMKQGIQSNRGRGCMNKTEMPDESMMRISRLDEGAKMRASSTSVITRRSRTQSREADITGLALFLVLQNSNETTFTEEYRFQEWSPEVRSGVGYLAPERPTNQRVLVMTIDGINPVVLWPAKELSVLCYSAGVHAVNFGILTSDLRSYALKQELEQNVSEWGLKRQNSFTLRQAIEKPVGGSYRRSPSNSRDKVPEWAKQIQDRRPDLGFEAASNETRVPHKITRPKDLAEVFLGRASRARTPPANEPAESLLEASPNKCRDVPTSNAEIDEVFKLSRRSSVDNNADTELKELMIQSNRRSSVDNNDDTELKELMIHPLSQTTPAASFARPNSSERFLMRNRTNRYYTVANSSPCSPGVDPMMTHNNGEVANNNIPIDTVRPLIPKTNSRTTSPMRRSSRRSRESEQGQTRLPNSDRLPGRNYGASPSRQTQAELSSTAPARRLHDIPSRPAAVPLPRKTLPKVSEQPLQRYLQTMAPSVASFSAAHAYRPRREVRNDDNHADRASRQPASTSWNVRKTEIAQMNNQSIPSAGKYDYDVQSNRQSRRSLPSEPSEASLAGSHTEGRSRRVVNSNHTEHKPQGGKLSSRVPEASKRPTWKW